MNHKEMTAHIRKRIKHEGIAARVRLYTACGIRYIHVFVDEHGKTFTGEQARLISLIAKVNGLTGARRSVIDDSFERWNNSGAPSFHFEFHG